jgi:Ca-activated chloride channel family protein
MIQRLATIALLLSLLAAIGCNLTAPTGEPFRIISGSENQTLEPLVQELSKQIRVPIELTYKGSVDIMLELENGAATPYDAVWPANSMWIALGDRNNVVKANESIMRSPVVMGVKRSGAQRLGWIGRDVTVAEILSAAESGQLRFMMTSASQSNSGAAAYFGYLHAFAGNPDVLTSANLRDPAVRDQVKRILGSVNRTAGSSGWLKDLFLERYDSFDAMVNYESVVIEADQQLTKNGREPLYAIYPVDGLAIADSPLGYVNKGNAAKEEQFRKLQQYLLSADVQKKILQTGRRVGPLGVNPAGADPNVFRADWGIDLARIITPIKFPPPDVIREALVLYQTALRKPSFTIFCLDYSGSMQGKGADDMKAAMRLLLNDQESGRYLLQTAPDDVTVALPFNQGVIATWRVEGNSSDALNGLFAQINRQQPGGDTDIYLPVQRGLEILKQSGYEGRAAAVILMTDGKSNHGSLSDLKRTMDRLGVQDVPVYSILFGDASEAQLKEIAQATSGRVFDGRTSLIAAFREAKGYN